MASVSFHSATTQYSDADTPAVNTLDLEIDDGEFLVIVGPTGSGKSTALRMLAGLQPVTSGSIFIGDTEVTHMPPLERDLGIVFPNFRLYPQLTVAENIDKALKHSGLGPEERAERVSWAAGLLGLEDLADRLPKALSGGQRQRVAIGRAIVRQPTVFLMDDPLSNLDSRQRMSTRTEIGALHRRLGATTLFVTHDQVEAMTLGDRIAVMNEGELEQVDSPLALYDTPRTVFVAGFFGSPAMNLWTVPVVDGGVRLADTVLPVAREVLARADAPTVTVGIRAESFELVDDGIPVEVTTVERTGADAFVHGRLTDSGDPLTARLTTRATPEAGETVHLAAPSETIHVFATGSGERIS